MNTLNLDAINEVAPYGVTSSGRCRWSFTTRNNVRVLVGFVEDSMGGDLYESYQFFITNENDMKSPNDPYLWKTITTIIEEFFRANTSVLVYICDTDDKFAPMRMRLFERKFNLFEHRDDYIIKMFRSESEDLFFYGAGIFRKDHPQADEISAYADEIISWAENEKLNG